MDEQALARAAAEVGEDLRFQRKMWRAERFAWMALAAAVAGVFGNGLWSPAQVASADGGLRVKHERVLRWGAEYEFEIAAGAQGLRFDPELAQALRVLDTRADAAATTMRITPRVRMALVSGTLSDAAGATVPIRLAILP